MKRSLPVAPAAATSPIAALIAGLIAALALTPMIAGPAQADSGPVLGPAPLVGVVDAQLRRGRDSAWTGTDEVDDVQRVGLGIAPGGAAVVWVRAVNWFDPTRAQRLAVRGPARSHGFRVRYFLGEREVTAAATSGALRTAALAYGARTAPLRVVIRRSAGASPTSVRLIVSGVAGGRDVVAVRVSPR